MATQQISMRRKIYSTAYRCYYDELNDVHTASDRLNALAPPYVITVAPDQQAPPDFNNVSTKDLHCFWPRFPLLADDGAKRLPSDLSKSQAKLTGCPIPRARR